MRSNTTNELGQPVGWSVDVVAAPAPPTSPMVGRFCSLVRLDATAHASDLFDAYAAATDIGDWTYLPYGPFDDRASFETFVSHFESKTDPLFFAVLDVDGRAVGLASYLRITPAAASIEVGHIHFSRALQGTSAATEAMYLMMRRAFEGGYRRYEWKCDALNSPSRAAATRLGFTFEGIFRQATHYKGRNRDTAWFSITDAEWAELQPRFEAWLDPSNFDADGGQVEPLRTDT